MISWLHYRSRLFLIFWLFFRSLFLRVTIFIWQLICRVDDLFLFVIGAGIYLLWIRWRRLQAKELELLVHRQKERLDQFLMETLRIEKEQTQTNNVEQLQEYLDNITRIKMQALQELTEEELRGNQEFSIFLDQCSHLISRIQFKMLSVKAPSIDS